MRLFYSEKYHIPEGYDSTEADQEFARSIKTGSTHFPFSLYGRVSEFSGVFRGWVPNDDDPQYRLDGNYLSKDSIATADQLSQILTKREPFYKYEFPPRGPSFVAPWLFGFVIDYAISKGLDYVIEKLRDQKAKDFANKISIEWGNNNGNSLGKVTVAFSDGSSFTIENYPHSIERITVGQLEKARVQSISGKPINVVYDAWGRIAVEQKSELGTHIDIGK